MDLRFTLISMAQSGSKNFKCVCYGGGSHVTRSRGNYAAERRAHEEKLNRGLQIPSVRLIQPWLYCGFGEIIIHLEALKISLQGVLKKMLWDQSSAMRNGSLINEGIVSPTIIPIRRLCKGNFSMLFKDQAILKCNQTNRGLQLCTDTHALFDT